MTNFLITPDERATMLKCVERAEASAYWNQPRLTTMMDLTAAHNDTPLNFEALLGFAEYDFWHDMAGISRHINHDTGKLEQFFSPRCAQRYHPRPA